MKEDYSLILKEIKLKVTPKRLAILETLADSLCCLTPDEIWQRLREKFGRVGLPTVYKNLEELSEGGIISKVVQPERKAYYYFCKNRMHHCHFICLSCHNVEDIISPKIIAFQKNIERLLGGKVMSNVLQLNGLCRNCLKSHVEKNLQRSKYVTNKRKG